MAIASFHHAAMFSLQTARPRSTPARPTTDPRTRWLLSAIILFAMRNFPRRTRIADGRYGVHTYLVCDSRAVRAAHPPDGQVGRLSCSSWEVRPGFPGQHGELPTYNKS